MSQVPRTGTEEADLAGILRRIDERLTALEAQRETLIGAYTIPGRDPKVWYHSPRPTGDSDGYVTSVSSYEDTSILKFGANPTKPGSGTPFVISAGDRFEPWADGDPITGEHELGPAGFWFPRVMYDMVSGRSTKQNHPPATMAFSVESIRGRVGSPGEGKRAGHILGTEDARITMVTSQTWTGAGDYLTHHISGVINDYTMTLRMLVDTTAATGPTPVRLKIPGYHSTDPGTGLEHDVLLGTIPAGFNGYTQYNVTLPDIHTGNTTYPWASPVGANFDAYVHMYLPGGSVHLWSIHRLEWYSDTPT